MLGHPVYLKNYFVKSNSRTERTWCIYKKPFLTKKKRRKKIPNSEYRWRPYRENFVIFLLAKLSTDWVLTLRIYRRWPRRRWFIANFWQIHSEARITIDLDKQRVIQKEFITDQERCDADDDLRRSPRKVVKNSLFFFFICLISRTTSPAITGVSRFAPGSFGSFASPLWGLT